MHVKARCACDSSIWPPSHPICLAPCYEWCASQCPCQQGAGSKAPNHREKRLNNLQAVIQSLSASTHTQVRCRWRRLRGRDAQCAQKTVDCTGIWHVSILCEPNVPIRVSHHQSHSLNTGHNLDKTMVSVGKLALEKTLCTLSCIPTARHDAAHDFAC